MRDDHLDARQPYGARRLLGGTIVDGDNPRQNLTINKFDLCGLLCSSVQQGDTDVTQDWGAVSIGEAEI